MKGTDWVGLIRVLLLIGIGGAIGGLADLLLRTSYSSSEAHLDKARISGTHYFYAIVNSVWVGIAGAIAVQFIFVLLTTFRSSDSLSDIVFLLSISVVAGYSSKRILPQVSRRLEKQIEEKVEQKVEEKVGEKVEDLKKGIIPVIRAGQQETLWFTRALMLLHAKASPSDLAESEAALRKIVEHHPGNRYFTLVLARVQRWSGNLDSAIATLSKFITAKQAAGVHDTDFADALYNRACYYSCQFQQTKTVEAANRAIADLAKSVSVSSENANIAATDEDFGPVHGLEGFKAIVENKAGAEKAPATV